MPAREHAANVQPASLRLVIRSHRNWIEATVDLEAELRRVHPERLTESQFREMRSMFISHLQRLAIVTRETVELLDRIRARVGDDPAVWLEPFHLERRQIS